MCVAQMYAERGCDAWALLPLSARLLPCLDHRTAAGVDAAAAGIGQSNKAGTAGLYLWRHQEAGGGPVLVRRSEFVVVLAAFR